MAKRLADAVSGHRSDGIKYGYAILGKGGNPEYSDGLPKPAPGTDVLDLATWLDFHSDLREGANVTDLSEELIKKFGGVKGDMKSIKKALDIMKHQIEKLSSAADAIQSVKENADAKKIYEGYKPGTILHTETGNVRVDTDTTGTCCQDDKKATDTVEGVKQKMNL